MRPLRLGVVLIFGLGGAAHADDEWEGRVEAGAEWDSNVHRVEVDPAGTVMSVAAPLGRAGFKLDGSGDGGGGRWGLGVKGLVRKVLSDEEGEDVGVAGLDGRWDTVVGERRAQVGVRASYYDVVALGPGTGARTFALAAGDGVLVLGSDDGARFALSLGGRDFRYKPDADFDWRGVAVGARVIRTVWRDTEGDEDVATLDLSAGYQLDRRGFEGRAFTNGCAPTEPITPTCFVPTGEARGDLHHAASVELAYTGEVVATGGYQLAVNDSSSYGQSLVRHRVSGSMTIALPLAAYATAIVALQVDQYLDPLVLAQDVASQTFTSIDDENRSELSVRLSRAIAGGVAAELRAATYADSLSDDDLRFRRTVVYGGLTWTND